MVDFVLFIARNSAAQPPYTETNGIVIRMILK